ncbi:MAG TPA: hypothetical protein VN577_17400 [Terriglobales bacterium]|nr:hypothetical protein [Terriglobales bacterium]
MRSLQALASVALVLLLSCGGSGLPDSRQVTVTITPSTATISAGATVSLQGNATGFTSSPIVLWGIQESSSHTPVSACGKLADQTPPFPECTFGYVVFASVSEFPSTGVYHAPNTPGTYHVVFTATQVSTYENLQKSATATITVTANQGP